MQEFFNVVSVAMYCVMTWAGVELSAEQGRTSAGYLAVGCAVMAVIGIFVLG